MTLDFISINYLILLARPGGFEPPTYGFVCKTPELPNLMIVRNFLKRTFNAIL
jgi:hypothetical protein